MSASILRAKMTSSSTIKARRWAIQDTSFENCVYGSTRATEFGCEEPTPKLQSLGITGGRSSTGVASAFRLAVRQDDPAERLCLVVGEVAGVDKQPRETRHGGSRIAEPSIARGEDVIVTASRTLHA